MHRGLLGPTNPSVAKAEAPGSIRAQFGNSAPQAPIATRLATAGLGSDEFCVCAGEDPDVATQNAAHGSDAVASAEREIGIMFPPEAKPEAEAEEEE